MYNSPLFSEEIQAWMHGPVVKQIYQKYNVCKGNSIEDVQPVEIDIETAKFLELVYRRYGKYTGAELRNMSHLQNSYKNNYMENERNVRIPQKDILKDFVDEKEALLSEFKQKELELADFAETCYVSSIKNLKDQVEDDSFETVEVDWKNEL